MKNKIFNLALLSVVGLASYVSIHSAQAKNGTKVIWIEEPDGDSSVERDLKKRIQKLERAVNQLQRKVFELEYKDDDTKKPTLPKKYTCYVETTFEGIFTETRESLTEAKAAVVDTCSKKTNNSMNCKVEKVVCGD